jgi:nucleoside-diphosphate-sugar epimerase
MRIFITGSSGLVGKEIIKTLGKKYEFVTYDVCDGQDILDYEKVKKTMKGCEVVIHLAAIINPPIEKPFEDYLKINCLGTFNVAKAAMENKVKRLIFASSTIYYGAGIGFPAPKSINENSSILTQRVKVTELTSKDFDVAYSTSKVIAEQILANFGLTKKFEVIMLRLGPVRKSGEYRPFGDLKLHLKIENCINAFERAIETKQKLWYEPFTIVDDNKNVDTSRAKKILNYKPE